MVRWTASAKWAAGSALDGRRATLLAFRLSEGLGITDSLRKVLLENVNVIASMQCIVCLTGCQRAYLTKTKPFLKEIGLIEAKPAPIRGEVQKPPSSKCTMGTRAWSYPRSGACVIHNAIDDLAHMDLLSTVVSEPCGFIVRAWTWGVCS